MIKRLFILIFLLTVPMSFLWAQILTLKVNDDLVAHNSTYGYYPDYFRLQVTHGNKKYDIQQGIMTLIRGQKAVKTVPFASITVASSFYEHNLAGGRIAFEVTEISDPQTQKKYKIRKVIAFNLSETLRKKPVADPDLTVLINGSTDYMVNGIDKDSVQTVEVRLIDKHINSSVNIIHARGRRAVKEVKYTNYLEFQKSFLGLMQDPEFRSGDRLIIEFKEAIKIINVPFK